MFPEVESVLALVVEEGSVAVLSVEGVVSVVSLTVLGGGLVIALGVIGV